MHEKVNASIGYALKNELLNFFELCKLTLKMMPHNARDTLELHIGRMKFKKF